MPNDTNGQVKDNPMAPTDRDIIIALDQELSECMQKNIQLRAQLNRVTQILQSKTSEEISG